MRASSFVFFSICSIAAGQGSSLSQLLASQPDLSLLFEALTVVPGFATLASEQSNVTLLAPTNAAFDLLLGQGLNAENQAISTRDPDGISTLLSYHILNGTYLSTDFTEVPTYCNTFLNQSYSIFDTIRSNVTNGQNVGLVLNGGNATIISGELQTSNVVQADITTIPDVTIHKIDKVLTIPLNLSDTLVRLPTIGTAAALGAFDSTDLINRIDTQGESSKVSLDTVPDLTVFIPNNAAFTAIGSILQNITVEALTEVLNYHAIEGAVIFASDIFNTTVASLQGNDLTITVGADGTIYVDSARVVFPNILLSNGVAHIIDQVLNPNSPDIDRRTLIPSGSIPPAFSGASSIGTMTPFTQSAIQPSTVISIPAIATTAQFVKPDVANATVTPNTTVTVSASRTATYSTQFTGAADRLSAGLGVAIFAIGAALVV